MIARFLVATALWLLAFAASADTPIALFKSFAGNLNFVGTEVTLRTGTNYPCQVYSANTAFSAPISGIPASATIVSAQLYWAGSGGTPDYSIGFEGATVSAPVARQFTSATIGNGYDYFSGAVDVTAQVTARRNGNYQFYGLTVANGEPYCSVEGVVGGYALLIIYSDASEPFRVLNLYEGFQFIRYSELTLNVSNFRTPTPLGSATGRIAHITWEGDATISGGGEDLLFNNTAMTDSLNPSGNQFNSKSNMDGDPASYGIDFDAYTVGSPIIGAGQTSATTTYKSGQDLVLLNAELVALPNVPAADLVLTMTRNDPLKVGQNATYTLSVLNAGPSAERNPVVTDTLPSGLSYVSAAGTGWVCAPAGQVVTCTYSGNVANGATMPAITLTVSPTVSGELTNSATVNGTQFDYISANNSSSDTATAAGATQTYVFTDIACKPNVAFGTAGQCNVVVADQRVPATYAVDGYLTAVVNNLPVARGTAANTATLSVAMTCVSPLRTANVKPVLNGTTLNVCADGPAVPTATSTAWSAPLSIAFAANAPSAKITFVYADVGKIRMSVKEGVSSISSSPTIIFTPASLRLTVVGNPATVTGTSAPFRTAGSPFPVKVDALMLNGVAAPNFGNGDAAIDLVAALPSKTSLQAEMVSMPTLTFTGMETGSGGAFNGTASFFEVGAINLRASVRGGYFGVADVSDASLDVGRFYPASFKTVATKKYDCLPATMACPTGVSGAVYATQSFDVTVTPLDINNVAVKNFNGDFARDIKLTAFDAAGSLAANPPSTPTGARLNAAAITAGTMVANGVITGTASYTLPVPFTRTAAASSSWTVPTPIFLRATSDDSVGGITVTSRQATTSLEGGITVLNGRLKLSNPYGSELLKLPVTMEAQYWSTGRAWTRNVADVSAVPASMAVSNCRKNLLVSGACYSGLAMAPKDSVFKLGVAQFWIQAPGAGRNGSVMFNMTGAPLWLPSTLSQATFGLYKSNFIYVRELY